MTHIPSLSTVREASSTLTGKLYLRCMNSECGKGFNFLGFRSKVPHTLTMHCTTALELRIQRSKDQQTLSPPKMPEKHSCRPYLLLLRIWWLIEQSRQALSSCSHTFSLCIWRLGLSWNSIPPFYKDQSIDSWPTLMILVSPDVSAKTLFLNKVTCTCGGCLCLIREHNSVKSPRLVYDDTLVLS